MALVQSFLLENLMIKVVVPIVHDFISKTVVLATISHECEGNRPQVSEISLLLQEMLCGSYGKVLSVLVIHSMRILVKENQRKTKESTNHRF